MSKFIGSQLIILFVFIPAAHAGIACQKTCGGSGFVVDLQARCLCLGNGTCFKVDIGKDGPSMTTSGKGKTGPAQGAKYQTKSGPGTTGYDNDAIATGIPANDGPGKWIHKTRACAPGGNLATKGCIGVPCDEWPLVKKQMGQPIEVCGSAKYGGTSHMPGYKNSAETPDDDGDTRGTK